jgi:hypothetical protein
MLRNHYASGDGGSCKANILLVVFSLNKEGSCQGTAFGGAASIEELIDAPEGATVEKQAIVAPTGALIESQRRWQG